MQITAVFLFQHCFNKLPLYAFKPNCYNMASTSFSAKIYYNRQRIQADGTATVYLRVIMNREVILFNQNFSWPVRFINTNAASLLARWKNDHEAHDYNMLLAQELSKMNEVNRLARLAGRALTVAEFKTEYKHFETRLDFIEFWQRTLAERRENGSIRTGSADVTASSLECLRKYRPTLAFHELTIDFLDNYKNWMFNKQGYDSNTVHAKLKDVRTYINIAIKKGYVIEYPFKGFKMPKQTSRIEYLNEKEFTELKQYFFEKLDGTGTSHERSCRAWLFISYTGLRIGDAQKVTHNDIRGDVLRFIPTKSTRENQRVVEVPLIQLAKDLINTGKGKILQINSEAGMRADMADIAKKVKLQSTCSAHVGRHTFATRFLRAGGRLEVLKELLGHKDIKTTMIYVHVDLARKKHEINLLN